MGVPNTPTLQHSILNWRSMLALATVFGIVAGTIAPIAADTVALWLFDEPVGSPRGTPLRDASGNGMDLELGAGNIVASGKSGNGLACPTFVPDFVKPCFGWPNRISQTTRLLRRSRDSSGGWPNSTANSAQQDGT